MENGNGEAVARLKERFARAAQDQHDLNNEMAGRDVGRIERFFSGGSPADRMETRAERERRATETQLQLMMANAAYRALHERTAQILQETQNRIDTVLERVQLLQAQNAEAIEALEASAARLPDGSMVFQDRAGDVRHRDGALVEAELAATILWRGDEPGFEEWQELHTRAERLDALGADALAGQARIGELEGELHDEDNPPSEERLEAIQEEAQSIAEALEAELTGLQASAEDLELLDRPSEPAVDLSIDISFGR